MKSSATIDINRPIDDVFAYIADPHNMEQWVVGVTDVQTSSDRPTAGMQYTSNYTYGGRTEAMTYVVTGFESPTRYSIRGEGPFPFEGELSLEPTATGTRVTNSIDAGSDSRFTTVMFTLFAPVMRRVMAKRLKAELVELKGELESPSRPEAPA